MSDEDAAFRIILHCENCGERWEREFPEKTRVWDRSGTLEAYDTTCSHGLGNHCGCREQFDCPTCDLSDTIAVDEREPLGGREVAIDEE